MIRVPLHFLLRLVPLFALASGLAIAQESSERSLTPERARLTHDGIASSRIVPVKDNEQFVPYWTADGGWHTELQLRNNLVSGNLTITPILRTADGVETALKPLTILSGEVRSIDLNEAIAEVNSPLLGGGNVYGSIALRYKSPSWRNLYASVMIHDSGRPIMYHLDGFHEATQYVSGSREGIWWLPTTSTRDFLIVTNYSNHIVRGKLWLYDAVGKSWDQPIQLDPRQTQRLSIRQLINSARLEGLYGGIKIEVPQGAGSLDTAHLIYDETAGFSATMKMFSYAPSAKLTERDYAKKGVWTTRAPMLALSQPDPVLAFPAKTVLQPTLLLRNITGHTARIILNFHWRSAQKDGRASLAPITLAALESRAVDVRKLQTDGAIPLDAYWAQVTMSTNTLPDEVIAIAASYDKTLRYGAQTPFSDQLIAHLEGGQWLFDSTHTSLIAAGNGGDKPIKVALTLFYDQGRQQYRLETVIAADDQWWVDVGQLIRERTPDMNGNILPASLTAGSYQLRELSQPEQNLLYEGKVVTDKTFGHATYGCMICCGYNTGLAPIFIADPTFTQVIGTSYIDVYAANACGGNYENVGAYFDSWWSSNNSIFTAQSKSITGVAPGTALAYSTAGNIPWGDGDGAGGKPWICPMGQMDGQGTGNVTQTVVNSANLWTNQISVTLSGNSNVSGNLSVTLVGSKGSYTFQYGDRPVGPGSYTVTMNRPNIPKDNYTSVRADWDMSAYSGAPSSGSLPIHWNVRGVIRHSQYNTPYESGCSSTLRQAWIIVLNGCQFTPVTLKSVFVSQVYINGTGVSQNYGILKYTPSRANQCAYPPGADESNTFLQVNKITGSCNRSLDVTSVATYPNPTTDIVTYGCGDNLQLISSSNTQQAMKYPEDYCPGCNDTSNGTDGHIDDYTSSQGCSPRTVGDYGNFWTADTYDKN